MISNFLIRLLSTSNGISKKRNFLDLFKYLSIILNTSINSFLLSSMLTQNNDQDFFSLKNSDQINLLDKSLSLESVNTFTELLKQTRLVYNNVKDNLESIYLWILIKLNVLIGISN